MLTVTRTLPTTKTYPDVGDRRYERTALPDGRFLVVIRQGVRDAEVYLVGEDTSEAFPGRSLLFARQTGPIEENRDGEYRCTRVGGRWECTCTGSVTRFRAPVCKHAHTAESMELGGDFNPPPPEPSGLWSEDEPGEPTMAEAAFARVEADPDYIPTDPERAAMAAFLGWGR